MDEKIKIPTRTFTMRKFVKAELKLEATMGAKRKRATAISTMRNNVKAELKLELPKDVIIDILCKLQLRDVIRFSSVSKEWEHVLKDPYYRSESKSRIQPAEMLLFNGIAKTRVLSRNLSASLPSELDRCQVLDCSHGLLLLRRHRELHTILYNPVNQETVHIPDRERRGMCTAAVLAFDPRISHHYKVVEFEYSRHPCHVFSSETWEWSKNLELDLRDWQWDENSTHIYLNGALYNFFNSRVERIPINVAAEATGVDFHRTHDIHLPLPYSNAACVGVNKETIVFAETNAQVLYLSFGYRSRFGQSFHLGFGEEAEEKFPSNRKQSKRKKSRTTQNKNNGL